MLRWEHLTAGILSVVVLASFFVVFLLRWCCYRQPEKSSDSFNESRPIRSDSFQARISKLHQTSLIRQLDTSDIKHRANYNNNNNNNNYCVTSPKPFLFAWTTDHLALVSEAIENGWSRFGFGLVHSPTSTPPLSRTAEDPRVVFTWEVSNGSVDFTQTIKFVSPAFREAKNSLVVLRAALPLPGPQLVNSTFPHEAYFEITISIEGEEAKQGQKKLVGETAVLSIGLATGMSSICHAEARLPGKFPASIGFQSDGAIYLDGMKLVSESEKNEWAKENKVVGCGYDPRKKKVYFTVNSHLVHVINCKADEFGTPLYPILASNTDVRVLVNLGQFPFSYSPANSQRTPNPCVGLVAAGLDDSKDLFSIGRLDSQYLSNFFISNDENPSGRTNTMGNSNRRKLDYEEEESDADLFEITLESSCKKNTTHLTL